LVLGRGPRNFQCLDSRQRRLEHEIFLLLAALFVVALKVVPPRISLEMIALGLVVPADVFFLVALLDASGASREWGLSMALVVVLVINVGAGAAVQ
jgi:hypothetical protein